MMGKKTSCPKSWKPDSTGFADWFFTVMLTPDLVLKHFYLKLIFCACHIPEFKDPAFREGLMLGDWSCTEHKAVLGLVGQVTPH